MTEVDGGSGGDELAVVCRHGKHRSVGVAILMLACVYYNAVLVLHNRWAVKDALRWLEIARYR